MTEKEFGIIEIGSILSEDGTVKFDFMTSLEKIAVAKVASNLWINQYAQKKIVNLLHRSISSEEDEFIDNWKQIKDNIIVEVSELCLPRSITKTLKKAAMVLGNSILGWLQYYDKCILNTGKNSKFSAVDLVSHITWTARGKIDLTITAKNVLASQGNSLSDDQKYKIACAYCLEDEIAILAPKVLNQYYLDNVDIDTLPMVYFWTTYITGDNTKLYNHYNDYIKRIYIKMSINEYILWLLTQSEVNLLPHSDANYKLNIDNTVHITYMWNKLREKEKAKNIKLLIGLCNQDLIYSLLSNVNYEQQQIIFKECSGTILVGMLEDWLWEEYFIPIALHVLEILNPRCYEHILRNIIKKMHENYYEENNYLYYQYKYYLKKLWQDSSRRLKDYIFAFACNRFVFFSLSWQRDLDVIDLIFQDANYAQLKKNVICGKEGIEKCAEFIKKDEWDLLDSFIKYILSAEEDIIEFKETLIRYGEGEIVRTFLKEEAFDKIEHLMIWAFKSEKEIDNFRQSLSCHGALLESIIKNNKVDFTKIENHFKWCAKGDLELINKFKYEILESYWGQSLIKKIIINDQYELLDQVLDWCYLGNQKQIEQLKCNRYKIDFPSVVDILLSLLKKDEPFKILDKFMGWSFTDEQQVEEFKATIICPQSYKHSYCVCAHLLRKSRFKLADEFIKWCGISSEDEILYKNELIFYIDILYLTDRGTAYLELLIKWLKPSEETVQNLKETSEEESRRRGISTIHLNAFLKLLDEFIEN